MQADRRRRSAAYESRLCDRDGFPPAIWVIGCTGLEDPVGDGSQIPGDLMTRVMFGESLGKERLVVVADRVVALEGSEGSGLVDGLKRPGELGFAPTIGTSAAGLLERDQTAVAQVLAGAGKAPGIDDDGKDGDSANGPDAGDRQDEFEQVKAPAELLEECGVLVFGLAIVLNVLVQMVQDE